MQTTRRRTLALGAAAGLGALMPGMGRADPAVQALIDGFARGRGLAIGGITLTLPDVAENGFTVPIAVAAPGATEILLIAPGNPVPALCTFRFGTAAPGGRAATRVRLARSQEVIALARFGDGRVARVSRPVEVTVGGCGA